MTSLTLQLDNDLCSTKSDCDTSEQIIKLFPKCRPRSDINLNPILITSQEHECTDNEVSNSVMSTERNTERWDTVQNFTHSSVSYTFSMLTQMLHLQYSLKWKIPLTLHKYHDKHPRQTYVTFKKIICCCAYMKPYFFFNVNNSSFHFFI